MSTTVAALLVIIVVLGAAVVYSFASPLLQGPASSSSSTPSSSVSSTGTTTMHHAPDTLTIDDWIYPYGGFNQLSAVTEGPYPNWADDTVYQPLVGTDLTALYSSGNVRFIPSIATWTNSSDGLTYTFTLNPNMKFSDGNPVNSYGIWLEMYAFFYLSGNSSNFLNSYPVFDMSGVKFGPSTLALINQSGVVNPSQRVISLMENNNWPIYVTSPSVIVFHLSAPFLWFPGLLTSGEGLIFDTQYVLEHGGFGTASQINSNFATKPIPGSGPYMFTKVSDGAYATFTQNPTYWGNSLTPQQIAANPQLDPGHVKNVVVNYKADDIARYTDLSTGAAQIAQIQSENWNLIQQNPTKYGYLLLPAKTGGMNFLNFNTHLYPTNITAVRQAIVHAINYTTIIQKVWYGQATPIVGPESLLWPQFYNLGNRAPYSYNLTLAKQYLAAANIKNIPPITFTVLSGCGACVSLAEIVQSELSDIGIKVNINVATSDQYFSLYGGYNYNVKNANNIPNLSIVVGDPVWVGFLTPADLWITFVSNQSVYGNFAAYSNPVVEQCVKAFLSSSSVSTIQSTCTAAQTQVYNDAPYAWIGATRLWQGSGSLAYDKSVVSGFYGEPLESGYDTAPLFNTVTFT